MIKSITASLLGSVLHFVTAANVCGLENVTPCDPFDPQCVPKHIYPALRNWFQSGYPEYFMEPVDVLSYDHMEITVEDGAYHLHQVIVTGMQNTTALNFLFDRNYYAGSANYTYEITVKLQADSFYKVDREGKKVTCDKPLCARLGKVLSYVVMPVTFLYRCDGSEYMDLRPETFSIKKSPKTYLKFDYGKPLCTDTKVFKSKLITEVAGLATKATNSNIRQLYKIVDVNQLFDFTSYHKRLEKQKRCGKNIKKYTYV